MVEFSLLRILSESFTIAIFSLLIAPTVYCLIEAPFNLWLEKTFDKTKNVPVEDKKTE